MKYRQMAEHIRTLEVERAQLLEKNDDLTAEVLRLRKELFNKTLEIQSLIDQTAALRLGGGY